MQQRLDDKTQLAWAAGIIDGEGTTYYVVNTNRKNGKVYKYPRVRISVGQYSNAGTPEMLSRLQYLFGGSICGPYYFKSRPTASGQYIWSIQGYEWVQSALAAMWPWLCSDKKNQAIKALSKRIKNVRTGPASNSQ